MAEDYSTIQQHQPLRVPQGWDKQERALIVQLDETFDDIYRRFGRLRMEDMGKKFRKQIEDDEGNIAQMALDTSGLTIEVGNKISKTTTYQTAESIVMAAESYTDENAYGKVSGITINNSGIDVTGSKYVKISSGGTFEVDSTNFKIDSANKLIESGKFKFDDTGITFTDNGYKLKFGRFDYLEQNVMAAVLAEMSNNYEGKLRLVASPGATATNASFELQCVQRTDDTTKYIRRLLFKGNGIAGSAIGCDNHSGGVEFAQIGTIVVDNENLSGSTYGGIFKIIFDPYFNPISQYYVPNDTPRVEISHNEAVHNGAMRVYYFNNAGGSDHIYVENVTDVPTLNVTNLTYTNIYQSSSKEIKHDIQPMHSKGEMIDALQPVTFVYDNDENETVRSGLIYEDTVEVMPEICTGDESNKAINYVELIPILLKEIQELRARVASLEGGQ